MLHVLYASKEAKRLPPGLYLGLFHGRDDPDQHMEDWGYSGPVIGPILACQTTYASSVAIRFETLEGARRFFSNADDVWCALSIEDQCLVFEGKLYGDWTVYFHKGE